MADTELGAILISEISKLALPSVSLIVLTEPL